MKLVTIVKIAVLTSVTLVSPLSLADCPLNTEEPHFNCTSYEMTLPLNIATTGVTPALTVLGGQVGLGTSTPGGTLDIVSAGVGASDSQLILRNPNAGSNSSVVVNNYSANQWRGSSWYIKDGSGTIYGISTADSTGASKERLRITSQGRLGIGTSTPGAPLEVAGAIRADQICDRTGANCKDITTGWGSGGGGGSGTVTSIIAGTGLTGGTITTSGTIAVDVGTTAGKIVQLTSSGALPAVSGTNLTSVSASKLSGKSLSISSLAAGQTLGYNGTNWVNKTLTSADISDLATVLGTKLDVANMPASCASNQTLTFSSPTGAWACSNIAITPDAFGSQGAAMVLAAPTTAAGVPSFRALASTDLPSSIRNGLWTVSGSNISRPSGNVGIGVSGSSYKFSVTQTQTDPTGTSVSFRLVNNPTFSVGSAISVNNAQLTSSTTVTSGTHTGSIAGLRNVAATLGAGTVSALYGINNTYQSGGIVTNSYGFYQKPVYDAGSATTTSYNIYLATASGTGTVTKEYGMYQQSTTALNYFGGKLGLGRTSPSERLHVASTDATLYSPTSATIATPWPVGSGAVAAIQNTSATAGTGAFLQLVAQSTSLNNHAYLGALSNASGYAPTIVLGQRTGSNGYTERLRIDPTGKVGIGTTAPGSTLDVAGTLRADAICDRTGANCKNLTSGWTLTSAAADSEVNRQLKELKEENAQLRKQLQELATKVNSLL